MKIGGPYVGRKSILELFGERGGGLAGGWAGDDRTKKVSGQHTRARAHIYIKSSAAVALDGHLILYDFYSHSLT